MAESESKSHTHREEFRVDGEHLLAKVKELIKQGNIRRIIIKSKEGKSLIELPLTVGVAGVAALAVLAPALAAVGAVAALVTECSIIVEREEGPTEGRVANEPTEPATPADK
jgi:hypothetical protein